MNRFEYRKKNDIDWYSESFYTHPRGYKMCVQVYANGSGKAKGTHVSLFTRIMKGEHDDELSWPFQGKITVELLNQNGDKDHYMHAFSYTEDCKYGRRVEIGEKNYGWGFSEFISHSVLNQYSDSTVQYLKDDCLKFQLYCSLSVDCYCNNVLLASAECREPLTVSADHLSGCGVGVKGRWGSAAQCGDLGKVKYIFIGLQWLLHVYLVALNTGICFLTIMGGSQIVPDNQFGNTTGLIVPRYCCRTKVIFDHCTIH